MTDAGAGEPRSEPALPGPAYPGPDSPTLAECFASGRDNFLQLRLLAAAAVIFGHSYGLAAVPGLHDFVTLMDVGYGAYTGSLAVDVFFVISGFLVTASFIRRDFRSFAKSRLLRVVPGYFVCISLTALVLGPLMTTLPLADYFARSEVWSYIASNLLFSADQLKWALPGVFESNPKPSIVNGSLWTLPAEMQMYVSLALIGLSGIFKRPALASVAVLGLIFSEALKPDWSQSILHRDFLRIAGLFCTGALFYLNAGRIRLNVVIVAGLCFACFLFRHTPHHGYLLGLTVAYATLWLAYVPRMPLAGIRGDYSYGLYLWGYPCQQVVVAVLGDPMPLEIFFLSLLPALALAMLSWHLVEKPALRLKNWRWRARPAPEARVGG